MYYVGFVEFGQEMTRGMEQELEELKEMGFEITEIETNERYEYWINLPEENTV